VSSSEAPSRIESLGRLVAVAAAALLAGSVTAQQPTRPQVPDRGAAPSAAAPSPIRVEPRTVSIGRVAPSTHHPVSFTIRNVSSEIVTIVEAKPSCKCTAMQSIAGRAIPPGGTLKLDATFDAPSVPGEKDAHIFILTQGAERPVTAEIKAMIVMPIEADPPFVDIRNGKLRALVKVAAVDGKPFRILSAGGTLPVYADATGNEIASPNQPQAQFVLVADFTKTAPNDLMQYWVVETDRDDCPIVPVQVRHELTGVKFDPTSADRRWLFGESLINAGRLNVAQPFSGVVEFTSFAPRGVTGAPPAGWDKVQSVRSLSPDATVEMDGVDARGDKVSVRFRLTPTAAAAGRCIYVPVELTTGTGTGRFFVTASVTTRTVDGGTK